MGLGMLSFCFLLFVVVFIILVAGGFRILSCFVKVVGV